MQFFFMSAAAGAILSPAKPIQVFVLAGQSNMQGHGFADRVNQTGGSQQYLNGTLEYLTRDPRTRQEFSKLKEADGKTWKTRPDVWVVYNESLSKNAGVPNASWHGELQPGFGGDYGLSHKPGKMEMGPELGFGWALGEALEEQVLLIKTAWGGKTLDIDFRPPSSGGEVGFYYSMMIAEVKQTLANLSSLFPVAGGMPSYELAGFAWHQGWNDACLSSRGGETVWDDASTEACVVQQLGGAPCPPAQTCSPSDYKKNMANLINDVRKDLGVVDLPVAIGVSGMLGFPTPGRECDHIAGIMDNVIIPAQLAVADPKQHPEFNGTVAAVETRSFHRPVEYSPGTQCFHWNNNCESYWRVGQAMGAAMLRLLPRARIRQQTEVS